MTVRLAEKRDALKIAQIHKQEIATGFLSSLPLRFLTQLYTELIASPSGFIVVAQEEHIIGFVAGTTSLNAFFRYFLFHSFFQALLILWPYVFNVQRLKKIVESLLYPAKERKLPQAELLTIAVDRGLQGQGIAQNMFTSFAQEMKKRGVLQFKVMVGEDLKPAIRFYEKMGFHFLQKTAVHGDQPAYIYVYNIS